MATSLGRLVLDMAANAAGFERDMQRVSKSAKKELTKVNRELWKAERDLDRARSKVNRLAGAMAAISGVAIAAAGREFRKFAQEANSLDKVSKVVSLTVEELQELRFAAEQAAGVNETTLDMAMQRFSRRVGEAANDTGELNTVVKELGVQLRNADGSVKSQTELLQVFADEIKNAGSEQEQLRIAFKLFDSEGAKMVSLMREGGGAIEELREQFRRTGATISQETVDATVKFNDSLNILSQNVKGLRNQFFADLVEPLSAYAEWLATTEEGQKAFNDILGSLAKTAKTVGVVIAAGFTAALIKAVAQLLIAEVRVGTLTHRMLQLSGATGRAATAITVFGRALSLATGPIGIAVAAIGTITIAARSASEKVGGFEQSINDLRLEMRSFMSEAQAMDAFNEFQRGADEAQARIKRLEQTLSRLRQNAESGNLPPGASPSITAAEIERLEAQLDAARDAFDENSEKAGEAYEEYIKLSEGADDASDGIAGAGDKADKSKRSFRDLSSEAAKLVTQLENLSDEFAGPQAQAVRQFTRQMQHAVGLFQTGAIGIETMAHAMRLFHQEMNRDMSDGPGDGLNFGLEGVLDTLAEVRSEMEDIARMEWGFENLIDSFHPLAGMMRQLGDDIQKIDADLNAGLITNAQAGMAKIGASANAAFAAMMSGVDRTSSEYKKLERAQQITNVALGIAAILQQGMGDPYTAIPRMIAMAAMVASLGVDAGGISGGSASQRRQDTQGTGSVLGDTEAKSESIANAVEITANATEKLVGINRGMAHSLRQLQEGLTGAATMLAQRGDAEFGDMNLGLSTFENIGNDIFDPLGLFGSTKVKDEGIELLGGAISDMTQGAVGFAFQQVKKSGLFGSSTKTGTTDLSDALNDQINLIFESMISTVESAGEALGIPLSEIQARIAAFEVEAQKISLKGLDAEEQQAELEAVFSRIFDDLAESVIPFIGQFQKLGEGMAETLVRVATSVQVAEEAIYRLGLNIEDGLGPEKMAQVSVGLVEAAGGIDQFISDMENFVSKFAPEAHQFAIAESDITRALEQMNMGLPETREGFWNLVQSIDATTESGQQAVATLLGLADSADTYYNELEAIESEREGLERRLLKIQGETAVLREMELQKLDESNRGLQQRIWALEREIELVEFMANVNQDLLDILAPAWGEFNRLTQAMADQIATARELGASEEQMMRLRRLHEAQMSQFIAGLEESIQTMSQELFGDVSSSMSSTASSVSSSMDSIRDSMINALERVRDWMDSSTLSNISPLVPQERLDEAERQFNEAFAAARGGDVDAISDLPGLADQFLEEAGGFHGTSTSQFDAIWAQVRDAMGQVADMEAPSAGPPTFGQTANIESATESTAMSAAQQAQAGWDILQQIALVSRNTEETPAEVAERLGVPLGDLLEAIGEAPAGIGEALETQFNEVAGGIQDEFKKLLDLESIAMLQLEELRRISGSDTGGKDDPHTAPLPKDPTKQPVLEDASNDGLYVVPRNGVLVDESERSEQLERIGALLERLESLTEEGNRHVSRTASNTGQQSRQLNELVIVTRDLPNELREAPRLRP